MERVDSLKRKFESQKLENESNKMRKLPSLLNIETRPNVKNETHKHQMFIRHVPDSFHFRGARLRVKGRPATSGNVRACLVRRRPARRGSQVAYLSILSRTRRNLNEFHETLKVNR